MSQKNVKIIKGLIQIFKSSPLAKGTLLLTVTGLLTKVLGFYNRIFLTRLIGVSELGIYQLSFPIFILGFSLCCQGLSTALTKHTAFHLANGNKKRAYGILLFCSFFSLFLGLLTGFFINRFADNIAFYILKNSDCSIVLKQLSLALPAMCIKGCINGFFLGSGKTILHGMSHLYEQLTRIAAAYILVYAVDNGEHFATLASVSVVVGEYMATFIAIYFCIRYMRRSRYFSSSYDGDFPTHRYNTAAYKEKSKPTKKISQKKELRDDIKSLLKDYLPITANDILSTLFSSFEAIILPAMLIKYYSDSDVVMEIYGSISCVVIPFLLFPATITTALSSVLLPSISKAVSSKDIKRIRLLFQYTLFLCLGLGLISTFFYGVLGEFFCRLIFDNIISGVLLKKMCIICPLIYLSGSMHTILIGLGEAGKNLIFYIASIGLRIFATMIFVPNFGVDAYIIGMLVSYLLEVMLLSQIIFSYRVVPDIVE